MPMFEFEQLQVRVQKLRYCAEAETQRKALRLIAAGQVAGQCIGPDVLIHASELQPCTEAVPVADIDDAGCPVWRFGDQGIGAT